MAIRISAEEYIRIKAAAKENKNVAKRLKMLELRYAGMSNADGTKSQSQPCLSDSETA